jgi:hypothetical protein
VNRVLATASFSAVNTSSHALLGGWINAGDEGRQVVPVLRTEFPDAFSTTGSILATLVQPAGSTFGVSAPTWSVGKGWTPGTASTRPTISVSPNRLTVPAGWTLNLYGLSLGTITGSIEFWDLEVARTELSDPFDGAVATPDLAAGPAIDSLLFMAQRMLGPQRFNKTTNKWEFLWAGAATHQAAVTFDPVTQTLVRGPIEPV